MDAGEILGLHHVKIPVTDLPRSRAQYERVFELEPIMEFPDDDGVVRGVGYRPKNAFALALRQNPDVARGIAGFDPFAILLQGEADVQAWADRLDALGVEHSPVIEATIGWILSFHDPDGLELRFYTAARHGADVSGRPGYGRPNHPATAAQQRRRQRRRCLRPPNERVDANTQPGGPFRAGRTIPRDHIGAHLTLPDLLTESPHSAQPPNGVIDARPREHAPPVAVFIAEMNEQGLWVVIYAQPMIGIADQMQDAWQV